MRIVYNTDSVGAPINKLGALQFLFSEQEADEDLLGDIAEGSSLFGGALQDSRMFMWEQEEPFSAMHPKTPSPGSNAPPTMTMAHSPVVGKRPRHQEALNHSDFEALVSTARALPFNSHLVNAIPAGLSVLPKKQRTSITNDMDLPGPSTPSRSSNAARPASPSAEDFSPPRSPSEADINNNNNLVLPSLPSPVNATDAAIKLAPDGGEEEDLQRLALKLATNAKSRGHRESELLTPEELVSREAVFDQMPPELVAGVDICEQQCWGFDSQVYKNISAAIDACSALEHSGNKDSEEFAQEKSDFIEHKLLPAMQLAWPKGSSLVKVLEGLKTSAEECGDDACSQACVALISAVSGASAQEKRGGRSAMPGRESGAASVHFQVRSKGTGVVCLRPDGIPAGTFVSKIGGEASTPWRWYEKQDALRRKNGGLSAEEQHKFVALERPRHADGLGFDVAFVDSTNSPCIGAKIAHSCRPNCMVVTVCSSGRLEIGVFTTRHINLGEELTWDRACVTEMEHESRSSSCLCSTAACRGFSLYHVNSKQFHEVLSRHHAFLDRTAMLLAACTDPVTQTDEKRIRENGVGTSLLTGSMSPTEQPRTWIKKWAALLLQYIEHEAAVLPGALQSKHGATEERAMAEASAVRSNRLHNLASTLDKAKYFLRKQPPTSQVPPLRMLSDREVIEHLWTGPSSIGSRFVAACSDGLHHSVAGAAALRKLRELLAQRPSSTQECRHLLRELSSTIGSLGPSYYAAHDCGLLYANTEHFFEPAKYHAVSTCIQEAHDESDKTGKKASGPLKKGPRSHRRNMDSETSCKKYRPGFLWGQMSAWYKQTVRDPSASLSADRRGTVSLPDPECCFGKEITGSNGKYGPKERRALVNHIENTPSVMWPLQTIWSFKNPNKVYGSPMLDVAIHKIRGDPNHRGTFESLLQEFKNTL